MRFSEINRMLYDPIDSHVTHFKNAVAIRKKKRTMWTSLNTNSFGFEFWRTPKLVVRIVVFFLSLCQFVFQPIYGIHRNMALFPPHIFLFEKKKTYIVPGVPYRLSTYKLSHLTNWYENSIHVNIHVLTVHLSFLFTVWCPLSYPFVICDVLWFCYLWCIMVIL